MSTYTFIYSDTHICIYVTFFCYLSANYDYYDIQSIVFQFQRLQQL